MWLVSTIDDAEKFDERVIVRLIGWPAKAPFKFVPIDHRVLFRKNIAHTSGLLLRRRGSKLELAFRY